MAGLVLSREDIFHNTPCEFVAEGSDIATDDIVKSISQDYLKVKPYVSSS